MTHEIRLRKHRKGMKKRFRMTTKNVAAFAVYLFFIIVKSKTFIFSGTIKTEEVIEIKVYN